VKVYSLADAQYIAEKLHRYSRKCDSTIPLHKCYDMVAWFNKHKTWQAFKPYLEELEKNRSGMLERMEKRASQSFDAYLADLLFSDNADVHWQQSEDLQKFIESYVEATEVSLQPTKDLNNLKSLCCKLDQLSDQKINELLINNSGFYFEIDPYGCLSFFDLQPPVSQDCRTRYVLVFPSDLSEEEFLEEFKSKLIRKAYESEIPTQKFLSMLSNEKNEKNEQNRN